MKVTMLSYYYYNEDTKEMVFKCIFKKVRRRGILYGNWFDCRMDTEKDKFFL